MSYWTDRTVLVTGAASGIGKATALRFASEGAWVAALDRDATGLGRTRQESEVSSRVLPLVADLEDEATTIAAVAEADAWRKRLDAVINVAGLGPAEDFLSSSREYWERLVQVNLRGTYLVAREGARCLIRGGGGAIVNVSSVLAMVGDPTLVSYSATKGGISAMSRAMAMNLAPKGIRVNAICPGDVATPLLERWIEEQSDPAGARAKIASSYPLGHICEPSDIAGVAVFLCGPDARCITGADIVVDCGLTARCY